MSSEMSTRVLIQFEHMLEGFQTMGAPQVQQSTVACVPEMRAFSPLATSMIVIAVLGSIVAVDICAAPKKIGSVNIDHMTADFISRLNELHAPIQEVILHQI